MSTFYDILGIPTSATAGDIRAAYKKLAKKYHPDKNPGSPWHEEQFKKVNLAYQTLSDKEKKYRYDLKLHYETYRQHSGPTVKNNPPYRTHRPRQQTNTNQEKNMPEYKVYLIVAGIFLAITIGGTILYYAMNRYTARHFCEQAQIMEDKGNYREAFMLYTDALSLNATAYTYEKRGDTRIKSIRDYKGAENDYTNAIVNTENPGANIYFKRAKVYLKVKKYNLALIDLDSVLAKNPAKDSARFYRAEINYLIENYEKAIPDYTLFYLHHPSSDDALLKRGFCYYKTEKYSEALNDFNMLISETTTSGEPYYFRAFTHFALKDTLKGCRDLSYAALMGYGNAEASKENYCR